MIWFSLIFIKSSKFGTVPCVSFWLLNSCCILFWLLNSCCILFWLLYSSFRPFCFVFICKVSDAWDKDLFFPLIISELFCSIWVFIPICSNSDSGLLLDTLSCELFPTRDDPKLLLSNVSLLFCVLLFLQELLSFFSFFFYYYSI